MPRKTKEADRVYFKKYYAKNKEAHKARQDKYLAKHPRIHIPDSLQGHRLTYLYKMSVEEYTAKLEEQKGTCALCPSVQGEHKRRMAVDHDHGCCKGFRSCGKCVRGILCANCNRAVGFLEAIRKQAITIIPERDTWLERAVIYIKKYDDERLDKFAEQIPDLPLYGLRWDADVTVMGPYQGIRRMRHPGEIPETQETQ